MSILTEEEKQALLKEWDSNILLDLIEGVEAAVLSKMAQQEPVARTVVEKGDWVSNGDGTYMFRGQLVSMAILPDDTPLYATPVPAAVPDGVRGFSMWLNREEWGSVIDGLILEKGRSDARKSANSESTSNVRSGVCVDLIKRINSESERTMLSAAPAAPESIEGPQALSDCISLDDKATESLLECLKKAERDLDQLAKERQVTPEMLNRRYGAAPAATAMQKGGE